MPPFKSKRIQVSFFDNQFYDRLLPQDHFLLKLDRAIDWSFIEIECKPFYSILGKRGENPITLFKMIFLAYYHDLSERRIEEECNYNMLFKKFLGLEPDALVPDHSTLTRFRDRLGQEGFALLYNRVVQIARDKGLVSDELHIIDCTHMTANVDTFRAAKNEDKNMDPNLKPPHSLPGGPDPDARFGAKSDDKPFFGYKHSVCIDEKNSVIVNSATGGGNLCDTDYIEDMLAGPPADADTADKLYDTEAVHKKIEAKKSRSLIVRKNPSPELAADPEYKRAVKKRKKIERVFAETKNYHGGRRARYWGKLKTTIQNLIISMVYDLKVITRVLSRQQGEVCLKKAI